MKNNSLQGQGKKKMLLVIALLVGIIAFLPLIFADDISDCGTLSSANTIYTLINNVNSTGTCFTIAENNITLDCSGYEINYSSDGGDSEYGVFSDSHDFTIIKNCKIVEGFVGGDEDYGIYFYGGNNGTIKNNTITTFGISSYGIRIRLDLGYIISNNTITTSNYGGTGIYLDLSSNFNTFLNNTITTLGRGIYLDEVSNNIFSANNIITSGENGYGIYLYSSSNNIFSANNIITSGNTAYGIYLEKTNNNSFLNMNINTNKTGNAFRIRNTNQSFTIIDSVLNSSYTEIKEIYIANEYNEVTGGTWDFINVTRADDSPITINWQTGANGTLNMMWYLNVNVTNSTSLLQNANVNSYDINNNYQFSTLTGIDGQTRQTLLEYKNENNTLITYYSNYTINTILDDYYDDSQSINMSENRQLNVILTLIPSPRFSITGQTIYEVMDSAGAGLGSFMNYLSQSIFGFLVLIAVICVFSIIGYALAQTIIEAVKNARQ